MISKLTSFWHLLIWNANMLPTVVKVTKSTNLLQLKRTKHILLLSSLTTFSYLQRIICYVLFFPSCIFLYFYWCRLLLISYLVFAFIIYLFTRMYFFVIIILYSVLSLTISSYSTPVSSVYDLNFSTTTPSRFSAFLPSTSAFFSIFMVIIMKRPQDNSTQDKKSNLLISFLLWWNILPFKELGVFRSIFILEKL